MLKKIRSAVTGYLRSTDHITWALCIALSGLSLLLLAGLNHTGFATERGLILPPFDQNFKALLRP